MIIRDSIYNPTDMNKSPYYNEAIFVGTGGYYKGNKSYQCVNYAMGRTCELAEQPVTWYEKGNISKKSDIDNPMFNRSGYGDAVSWWSETLWEKGSTPRLGAVMVYGSSYGGGRGHVRVVEKIENGKIFYSAANESQKMAFKWISIPEITSTGFLGYIYNPYVKENDMLVKFKLDKDQYEYKWSVDGNKYGEPYDSTTENGFGDVKLEAEGWELMLKVNGSLFYYFNDGTRNNCYACGLEKSRGVNNQEVSMSCVSDYNTCMSIAGYEEDLYFGKQGWVIQNMLDKSYCAITGLGLLLSGSKRDDLHKGFETQWNQKSGRTVIGEDENGNILSYSFAGETGKSGLTCKELQDKCLELGFVNAIALDGGGSVFRQYRNEQGQLISDINTSRKVKNALLLYRKKKPQAPNYEDIKQQYDSVCKLLDETTQKLKLVSDENFDLKTDKNELEEELAKVAEEKANLQKKNDVLVEKLGKIKELCE